MDMDQDQDKKMDLKMDLDLDLDLNQDLDPVVNNDDNDDNDHDLNNNGDNGDNTEAEASTEDNGSKSQEISQEEDEKEKEKKQKEQEEIDEWEEVKEELRQAALQTKQAMIEASNDIRLLSDPFKLEVLKKFLCPSVVGYGECLWQTEHGCLFQHVQPSNDEQSFIPFPDWICFGYLSEHCNKTAEDCYDGVHLTFEQLNDLDGYQRDHHESIEHFRMKCWLE